MNFVRDVLEPIYKFLVSLYSKVSGQEESVITQKITWWQFFLYFAIAIVVYVVLRILVGEILREIRRGSTVRAEESRKSKFTKGDLITTGRLVIESMGDEPPLVSFIGVHLKDLVDDPVEQSLSSGYLLLNFPIDGGLLFLDRSRRIGPKHSAMLYILDALKDFESGKGSFEYGYFEVEVVSELAGKFNLTCTEGSYLQVQKGSKTTPTLLLMRVLYENEEDRKQEGCDFFFIEEVEDLDSEQRTARVWKGNLIPLEHPRVKQLMKQEVVEVHPNGSQMKN